MCVCVRSVRCVCVSVRSVWVYVYAHYNMYLQGCIQDLDLGGGGGINFGECDNYH